MSTLEISPVRQGFRDGIPIAMGYFAVAFSLGIIAKKAELSMFEGFISSFFTRASAGEYGVYSLLAAGTTYAEIIGISLIANLRYLLMSASLSQKFAESTSLFKRIVVAFCITDEVFGISIAYPGKLVPSYTYSAALVSTFFWALGTAGGILAGDVLPANIVSALSVALYGMFLAIIIPPAQKDRKIGWAVLASFVISGICAVFPYMCQLGSGIRIILLTILISAFFAWLKPIKSQEV
ncbi:MAG: AzlC family ABC transporter permease [Bacteroidales bacterium]|nr:AzlC family ABC transporter permease [Bacteroidales bacterium]